MLIALIIIIIIIIIIIMIIIIILVIVHLLSSSGCQPVSSGCETKKEKISGVFKRNRP